MATHQQQHYVPRFLLDQWHTPPDNKLTSFRWAHGKLTHKRFVAKSVAKLEHLYSMQRESAQPDVKVERDFLGPCVDEPASLSHKAIVQSGVRLLKDQQKIDWARFLVSLLLRVPAMMEDMRARGRKVLAAGLDEAPNEYLEARGDAPESTLREWVEKNHPSVLDDLAVMTLPHLVQSQLLNNAFLSATWATRQLKKSRFDLLIADKPLIYVGTFETSFLVGLPIAPKLAFFAFNNKETWTNLVRQSDKSITRGVNLSSVSQAERYVYGTSPQQDSFVAKYLRK